MAVDSLDFGEALCAHARAARGRARGRRARSTATRCPTAADFDHVVMLGMGGSGIAGDIAAGRRHRDAPGAGHRAEALPHAGVRRAAHARVRGVVLGRHRGDARDGARRARRRCARSITISSGGELGGLARRARRAARAVLPTASRCRGSRSARWSRRSSSCCSAWACCPRRTPALLQGAAAAGSAAATSASPTVEGDAQPGARARAQDRPHDPDHLRQRRARRRGGDALEAVDERERQGAGVLERVPRARPQRDLRLGPARRRHPPGVHARRAAPRARAPAARARGSPRPAR